MLLAGIDFLHREKFEQAFQLFDSVILSYPENPVGYFFKAAAYANIASDYRNLAYTDSFFTYIEKAINVGKTVQESGNATSEDLLFYGGAVGYRGIYRSFLGDWFGAFKDGLRGKNILAQALDMDSTNYDVYYGLGEYDYWRSAKTRVLWWLPFISDKRNEGVEQIFLAIQKGKLVKSEAKYGLLKIYDNENEYRSILQLWNDYLIEINPDDPFSLYFVGRALAQTGRYQEAIDTFGRLHEIYVSSPYYDPASELDVDYNLGVFYYKWGRYDKAVEYLSLAKDLAESMSHREDVEEAVKKSGDYYKKALAALNDK